VCYTYIHFFSLLTSLKSHQKIPPSKCYKIMCCCGISARCDVKCVQKKTKPGDHLRANGNIRGYTIYVEEQHVKLLLTFLLFSIVLCFYIFSHRFCQFCFCLFPFDFIISTTSSRAYIYIRKLDQTKFVLVQCIIF
jgi:hypothetical protein